MKQFEPNTTKIKNNTMQEFYLTDGAYAVIIAAIIILLLVGMLGKPNNKNE